MDATAAMDKPPILDVTSQTTQIPHFLDFPVSDRHNLAQFGSMLDSYCGGRNSLGLEKYL
jgi:hypothetical protein